MAPNPTLSTSDYLNSVQQKAKGLPTNPTVPGIMQSLAPKTSQYQSLQSLQSQLNSNIPLLGSKPSVTPQNFQPIGVKTTSPQDNIKTPANTTPTPQVTKPVSSTSSTENGTGNTNIPNPNGQGNLTLSNPNALMQNVSGRTAGTPTPPTPPAPTGYQATNTGLYGQLVAGLANTPSQYAPQIQAQQDRVNAINAQAEEAKKQFAQQTNDINQSGTWTSRALGEQGQANIQNSNVLNALATQASQGQGLIQNLLSQQGAQQSALQGAASGAMPQAYSPTTMPYNPASDTYGGGGANGAMDRQIQAANILSAGSFATDYNTGKAKLDAAAGIEDQIVNTLNNNPTLNNTPISAFTDLARFFAGQTSDPNQQQLAQQVNSYITTLGLDPSAVATTASQSRGTLGQLLKSLQATAQAQVESKNPANLKNNNATTNTTGGSIYNF